MSLTITREEDTEIIYFDQLTEDEQKDLCGYDGQDESSFFRYNGNVYDLNDFMRISRGACEEMKEFDAYRSDSFFSGILIKLDGDGLTAAMYYS